MILKIKSFFSLTYETEFKIYMGLKLFGYALDLV